MVRTLGMFAGALALFTGQHISSFSLVLSEPAAGSVFRDAPTRIRLIFSEAVDPSQGRISLVSTDGQRVGLPVTADPHLVDGLIARVAALPSGSYRVEWRVVSARGAPLDGTYTFAFGPSASLPLSAVRTSGGARDHGPDKIELRTSARRGLELSLAVAVMALVWIRLRRKRVTDEHRKS